MMSLLTALVLFILGTAFGSLGSVLLSRLQGPISWETFRWILWGRSRCPSCHNELRAIHLIPLVSFFVQRGTCAYCHKKISVLYPLLELFCWLLFVGTYFFLFSASSHFFFPLFSFSVVFLFLIHWLLFLLFVHDIQTYELHIPLWILLLFVLLVFWTLWGWLLLGQALLSGLLLWFVFLLIYRWAQGYLWLKYNKKAEWFGFWDVLLAFALGLFAPFIFHFHMISFSAWNIFLLILIFVLLSSVLGLLYGVVFLFYKKFHHKKIKILPTQIPFIPSMILAFWLVLLFAPFFISLLW